MGIATVNNSTAANIKKMLPVFPRRVADKVVRMVEKIDSTNNWITFGLEIGVPHGFQVLIR